MFIHPLHHQAKGALSPGKPWAQAALYLTLMVTSVDLTIVNVALPTILKDLNASNSDGQWIVDAYTATVGGFVLLGSGLGDRFGRKKAFIFGIAMFLIGSLIASFAPTVGVLISGRVIMGLGAAFVLPASLSILAVMFTPDVRPTVIARWALAAGAGMVAGPILGGILVSTFWWGSVFLVTVPLVVIAGLIAWWAIPESVKPDVGRIDVRGGLLSIFALGGLVAGLIEGPRLGWTSPLVLALLVIGFLACLAFYRTEMSLSTPMFDFKVLFIKPVTGASVALFTGLAIFVGTMLLVPQFLDGILGIAAREVGLVMAIPASAFVVGVAVAKKLQTRSGDRISLLIAMGVSFVGCLALIFGAHQNSTSIIIGAASLIFGAGGIIMTVATAVIMNSISTEQAGHGSTINQLTRQLGAALGVAILGSAFAAIYSTRVDDNLNNVISSNEQVVAAQSFANAIDIAQTQGSAAGAQIMQAATNAFLSGFQVAFGVAAALVMITSVMISRKIPRK